MNLKKLKNLVNKKTGLNIDFRSDVYAANNYGLYPQINYIRCKKIIKALHDVLNENFGAYCYYNLEIEMNKIQTQTIKSIFECELFKANFFYNFKKSQKTGGK